MCEHAKRLTLPKASNTIYKEECTLCFENQDSVEGINVCLTCFDGSCSDKAQGHTKLHFDNSKHYLYLNIKRKRVAENRPEKMAKLAIQHVEPVYEFETRVLCYGCKITLDNSLYNVF
jgi:ubiquitin carboxyl-terminal hydrolase 5/13